MRAGSKVQDRFDGGDSGSVGRAEVLGSKTKQRLTRPGSAPC
jgi:hypothetical protein